MGELIALVSEFLMVISVLAFIISIITQVIKKLPGVERIPAELLVICLSLVITLLTFFGYVTYTGRTVVWYEVVAAFICGFIVAFIAMFGWEKFHKLWSEFRHKGGGSA